MKDVFEERYEDINAVERYLSRKRDGHPEVRRPGGVGPRVRPAQRRQLAAARRELSRGGG
jgi:hypothetical protein